VKKNQRLTIMVVPHDTQAEGVRQFSISSRSIRFAWLFLIGLVAFSVVGLANSINVKVDHLKLEKLREENDLLKKQVEDFGAKSERLEARLQRLEELVDGLRALAGIVTKGPRRTMRGRGGPVRESGTLDSLSLSKDVDGLLSLMEEEALSQEEALEEIRDVLEEKGELLAAIPFILPMSGKFTSGFGYRRCPFTKRREFHEGIDIANYVGTPIYAPADGVVVSCGWRRGYGRRIKIRHGFGYETVYGHLSRIMVRKGQSVRRGDLIGLSGDSGRSTGPHLHYEIRLNKRAINPWRCIIY
jgi:murein DD-endopeptidase MepM/ murein hydrolase activator NlpD